MASTLVIVLFFLLTLISSVGVFLTGLAGILALRTGRDAKQQLEKHDAKLDITTENVQAKLDTIIDNGHDK